MPVHLVVFSVVEIVKFVGVVVVDDTNGFGVGVVVDDHDSAQDTNTNSCEMIQDQEQII